MLPAWLGAGQVLQLVLDQGQLETLQAMAAKWPFFETRLSMLEMVFAKADAGLSAYYDERLVPTDLRPLGDRLRGQLAADSMVIRTILGRRELLETQPWIRQSIQLRNVYTDPLNYRRQSCCSAIAQSPGLSWTAPLW